MLGKYVLEGRGQLPLPEFEERAVTGWIGQQAGSATVPGGAEDALTRP